MQTVRINKDELLVILRENREKHIKLYEETVEDFIAAYRAAVKHLAKLARKGDPDTFETSISLTRPVSNVAEYDRAIRMLELEVDSVIKLEADEFQQYVQDQWHFNRMLSVQNVTYKSLLRKK